MFLFLFICSIANAELWVCQQGDNLRRIEGDGYKLGICEKNNQNINSHCILATPQQYSDASLQYKKLENGEVIDWTQAEIDAYVIAQVQAQADTETTRLQTIDNNMTNISGITLKRVDEAIDNIGNLQDAKNFLKKLCRYIASIQ